VPLLDWPAGLLAACQQGCHTAAMDCMVPAASGQADSVDSNDGPVGEGRQSFPRPRETPGETCSWLIFCHNAALVPSIPVEAWPFLLQKRIEAAWAAARQPSKQRQSSAE